jgi:hypothetical protein
MIPPPLGSLRLECRLHRRSNRVRVIRVPNLLESPKKPRQSPQRLVRMLRRTKMQVAQNLQDPRKVETVLR